MQPLFIMGNYAAARSGTVDTRQGAGHAARVHLIHNERVKLRAAALDRMSTAFVAIGYVAPWVSTASGMSDQRLLTLALSSAGWIFSAWVVHLAALRHLRNLRE